MQRFDRILLISFSPNFRWQTCLWNTLLIRSISSSCSTYLIYLRLFFPQFLSFLSTTRLATFSPPPHFFHPQLSTHPSYPFYLTTFLRSKLFSRVLLLEPRWLVHPTTLCIYLNFECLEGKSRGSTRFFGFFTRTCELWLVRQYWSPTGHIELLLVRIRSSIVTLNCD